MIRAVQQIMLGSVSGTEERARETLRRVREAGYDGIELNGFMIRPTPLLVRLLTKAAGMPAGRGGRLDWPALIRESGLRVVGIHEDLGGLEQEPEERIAAAASLGTDRIIITGMYRFDYGDAAGVRALAGRLNAVGERLKRDGVRLYYHNHNCELLKTGQGSAARGPLQAGPGRAAREQLNAESCRADCERLNAEPGRTAFELLLEETDPDLVAFEFDSYWFTEGGADARAWMRRMGPRMKLWHINDRGTRSTGPAMTPILKSDSMELGTGNMDLEGLAAIAMENGIEAVVLESHRNWIDKDPVRSLELSGQWLNAHF